MKPEIVILSIGDPKKVSTWSNVPHYFGKHLELEGCTVHYEDIGPQRAIQVPYDFLIRGMRKMGANSEHQFFRSTINSWATDAKIEKVLDRYPNAVPVFMTYTFGAPRSQKPYVLFSDRTFQQHIEYFHDRQPNSFESKCVERENENLDRATMIISFFPEVADELKADFGERVKYLGNVINLPEMPPLEQDALERKWAGRRLLFIGKEHYKEGLIRSIEALNTLNSVLSEPVYLDVIGLQRHDVRGIDTNNVKFHGYLNKAKASDFDLYMELLESAILFLNPNPRWAAFSASCEALYMSTPLIIRPYPEFTRTFGTEERAWWPLNSEEQDDLVETIQNVLSDKDLWASKAQRARETVADFSWSSFAKKFMAELQQHVESY